MEELGWGCCDHNSDDGKSIICVQCLKPFHYACLCPNDAQNDTLPDDWKCESVLLKKGKNENTPLQRRSTKRPAVSSPEDVSTENEPLTQQNLRSIVDEILHNQTMNIVTQVNNTLSSTLSQELKVIKDEMIIVKSSISSLSGRFEDIVKEQGISKLSINELQDKKHPKLFITQGGLQSTDEAITAGVPLIGMPMLGDQWFNVEQYTYHKIGIRLDLEALTEDAFLDGINTVINDDSFRKNIAKLGNILRDQPEQPLDRAIWWTEHVIRHGGAPHLRARVANMSWAEYLDVQLMTASALAFITALAALSVALYFVVSLVRKHVFTGAKLKSS